MSEARGNSPDGRTTAKLPTGIWALGFVSMFMDISSEMIHGLLPVFLTTVLGAGTEMVGLIEGLGEATASIAKVFSGWISDRFGRRKSLTLIGYGLGAASKVLFAVATSPVAVLGARFSDRVGKGVRGAPRDAMVADMVPSSLRGAAYGLRQSLDTVGAFVGPILAIALMTLFHDDFRLVFWLALIPGLIAVAVLALAVREPRQVSATGRAMPTLADIKRLPGAYWIVVAIGAELTLARFSEAFLILRAQNVGLSLAFAPVVLVVMNVVYAVAAYPLGAVSDRIGRRRILFAGFAVLILADLVLAMAASIAAAIIGVALWGLHMGMTQGLLAALVADQSPASLRGTCFGVFNLASGVALLLASLIAGVVWETLGPAATFATSAVLTAIGLAGTAAFVRAR